MGGHVEWEGKNSGRASDGHTRADKKMTFICESHWLTDAPRKK